MTNIGTKTAERKTEDRAPQNLNTSSLTDYIQHRNHDIQDFTDIQDQSSILIQNLNNSQLSQDDLDELQSLNAEAQGSRNGDAFKTKHKTRGKVQVQQSIFEQHQLVNPSQLTDHNITENFEKSFTKSKGKQNMNISQISPHKLNEFFQNNMLYSQTSKNNSISSNIGNEDDHQKRKKNPSKSPNSNGRQGKASRLNR